MLSSTSDYAVRAILALAQADTGRPMRADEIARATGAPANYLAKTLNALGKAGIVTSARGPRGGFTLALPADELTLARIVDCFDDARPTTQADGLSAAQVRDELRALRHPHPQRLDDRHRSFPQYDRSKLLLQIGKSEISLPRTAIASAIQLRSEGSCAL